MAFELSPLPYNYDALDPYIDAQTMQVHHDLHHQAYVNNLNAALEKYPELQSKSPEELIKDLSNLPQDITGAVRNNGGGHVNHTMFWQIMAPTPGENQPEQLLKPLAKTSAILKASNRSLTTQEQSNLVAVGCG